MKTEQLKTKIRGIIDSDPGWIDGVSTKELAQKLKEEKGVVCSIPALNRAMLSIVGETEDGYPTNDGNLVMGEGDCPNNGKSTGIKKYWWFIT
jgi:hypothetical protein